MALRPWPSFAGLVMDLVTSEREDAGWPPVDIGLTYDASVDSLPRYRVDVIDPQADRLTANVLFDFETLASTYSQAEALAFEADAVFMSYPVSTSSGGRVVLVDRTEVISSPAELGIEEESTVRRFLATYQLAIRRG